MRLNCALAAAWLAFACGSPAGARVALKGPVRVPVQGGAAFGAGAAAAAARPGVRRIGLGATTLIRPSAAVNIRQAGFLRPASLALPAAVVQAAEPDSSFQPAVEEAPRRKRALRLILSGPPGSGKSTIGRRLAAETGAVHISVGDLLREYAKTHPDTAERMSRGELVDAELVISLVRERLASGDAAQRGFLLDGFPRRLLEAEALAEMLGNPSKLDAVIRLDVPREELLRRILARGRPDDTEKAFNARMSVYERDTLPAIARSSRDARLFTPELSGSIEDNYARVWEAVKELLRNSP